MESGKGAVSSPQRIVESLFKNCVSALSYSPVFRDRVSGGSTGVFIFGDTEMSL